MVWAVIFPAFALPAVRSKPHAVLIGVVGPAQAISQVESRWITMICVRRLLGSRWG